MKLSEALLILVVSFSFAQHRPRITCPVRYTPVGCFFLGNFIPAGESAAFSNPCVFVSCSRNGQTVAITGCPGVAGSRQHAVRVPTQRPQAYPGCCERCRPLQ
uniref:Putative 8.9 kDa family member n=1 Tax=Rhipicephalus pulchellus TaxID=72859 RepID=L7LR55_RHIPC